MRGAVGAGLALALVPSLLWVLMDPISVRAVLLGLAASCLEPDEAERLLSSVRAAWNAVHGG